VRKIDNRSGPGVQWVIQVGRWGTLAGQSVGYPRCEVEYKVQYRECLQLISKVQPTPLYYYDVKNAFS